MAKIWKSRSSQARFNIVVDLIFAVAPILIVLIVSLFKKDIWYSDTFLYIAITCGAVIFFGILLGIIANRGGNVGFGLFIFSVIVNIGLLGFGVFMLLTQNVVAYLYASATCSLIIYSKFNDRNEKDGGGNEILTFIILYVLHIVVIAFLVSSFTSPYYSVAFALIEMLIFYLLMFRKCKKLGVKPFYGETSDSVLVEEQTPEEMEIEKRKKKQREKEMTEKIIREFNETHKEELARLEEWQKEKSSSSSSSSENDETSYWCRQFRNKVLDGAFIYTSAYADVSSIGDSIYVTVRITNIRDDDHSRRISTVRSNFRKIARKCPYSCSLNFE